MCGKNVVSIWHPDVTGYKFYCNECFWSDKWDGMEYGRDFDALLIAARPHKAYPINPVTIEQHRKLGVQHLILDPPASELTLDAYLEELERISEVCELRSEG